MGKELLNNNRELLLKDLCSRLPYKVYAQIPDEYGGYTSAIESIDIDGFVKDFEGTQIEIENIKPYLLPLSSMTKEQSKIYHELIRGMFGTSALINIAEFVDWCNKNHLDWRGLIPKGVALDATGLNIY